MKKNSLQGKIREFEFLLKIREKSGNFKKAYLCKVKIFKFYSCSDVATAICLKYLQIYLKVEYLFAVYSVFSFSHSEVDILLQTLCLSLN